MLFIRPSLVKKRFSKLVLTIDNPKSTELALGMLPIIKPIVP